MIRFGNGSALGKGRALIFRTPEDAFTDESDVAARHESEIRSPEIDRAISHWNEAKEQGDDQRLRSAARAIVDATSAAFDLQGVPTFAHPVLPPQFVKAETANIINQPRQQREAAIKSLIETFDPSAKPGAALQFGSWLQAARPSAMAAGFEEVSDGQSPFATAQARQPGAPGVPPLPPGYPPPGYPGPRNQPPRQPGQPPQAGPPRQQQLPWWQEPLLPPQPGDLPLQESQSGNYLAPAARLSPGLRNYLGGLDWRNPTDNVTRGQDNQGGGGFNGTRQNNGVRYPHGAQDQMAQPDQYVTAPVTGRLREFGNLPGNNWPFIDIELDHGVIVRVIHVEMPRDSAGRIYLRRGDTIRAGQTIGTQQIFANNNRLRPVPVHAHVQIMVPVPGAVNPRNNGPVYYLVDPSPYIRDPDYVN